MIIQYIKFQSELSEEEVISKAKERLPEFQKIKGLVQKYYYKASEPDTYGGIYIWDSPESLEAYRNSGLAATIAASYKVKGKPQIEILEGMFSLRE